MSDLADRVRALSEECLVRACWRQWSVLVNEGWSETSDPSSTIIDPEALVLASLSVQDREARLRDRLRWWASTGAHLMSIPRLRAILDRFTPDLAAPLAQFADDTGDARWSKLAAVPHEDLPARSGKGPEQLSFLLSSTLLLRMRAGFGVGAKADLLAFLIGVGNRTGASVQATAKGIALGTQYSVSSVRRALSDMCLARLVEGSEDRPPSYSLDLDSWSRLLELEARSAPTSTPSSHRPPTWMFLGYVFPVLASCTWWGAETSRKELHPTVQASLARDITASISHIRRVLGWREPEAGAAPGARYLEVFDLFVTHLCNWVDEQI